MPVPEKGSYKVIMNSNSADFTSKEVYESVEQEYNEFTDVLKIKLEGNSALYLKLIKEE